MALALHAARRPTLLFEFLDYPHQSLNFLFLESFVVQPQLRIGGSIGIQRDQSKAYLPLSTSKCHTRFAPLHLGRDSSGALLGCRRSACGELTVKEEVHTPFCFTKKELL